MNIRQLEIFSAVMRCRTTAAAAHELGVSQPAVSNAIKHFEDRLGLRLFDRVGNRLIPTAEAQEIYRDAEPLRAMSQAIARKAEDLRNGNYGHLRIIASHALGRTVVAEALRRFLAHRQRVHVFFDIRRMEGVIESVESGLVDLGLALLPPYRPAMEIVPVLDGQMVVAIPHGHPLAQRPMLSAADLPPDEIIGVEPASRLGGLVRKSFDDAGVNYHSKMYVRHSTTACALVEKGLGIAVVDEFSAGPAGHWKMEIRPFAPTTTVLASVMYQKGRGLSELATRFVNEVRGWRDEPGRPAERDGSLSQARPR